jgi:hypothetical protein
MRTVLFVLAAGIFLFVFGDCTPGKDPHDDNQAVVVDGNFLFENSRMEIRVSANGGMFTGFVLKDNPLNPFGWALLPEQMPKNNQPHIFAGHFLCTGRWGSPTPGEMDAGIPHNGEVNTQEWIIVDSQEHDSGANSVRMTCTAPIERLDVERQITIPAHGSWFWVHEKFTNNLPVGRLTNFVQHGTVFSPFLSPQMVVNTNATKGFDQRTPAHLLEESSFIWPYAVLTSGEKVDLTHPHSEKGFVTTHIFPDTETLGWITAYNPDKGILMGYVFKVVHYPWFNYWNHAEDGKPFVVGLEFGTTGLGQPYDVLLSCQTQFFGMPSYTWMDAGETVEKGWLCFQMEVGKDLIGVDRLFVEDGSLQIKMLTPDGSDTFLRVELEPALVGLDE